MEVGGTGAVDGMAVIGAEVGVAVVDVFVGVVETGPGVDSGVAGCSEEPFVVGLTVVTAGVVGLIVGSAGVG